MQHTTNLAPFVRQRLFMPRVFVLQPLQLTGVDNAQLALVG
jgi:hypothetical protein